VPKGKKIKVWTHRPRYIEMVIVPKLGEGTSSTAKAEQAAPAGRSAEESTVVPKVSVIGSAEVPKHTAEDKGKAAEKPDLEETIIPPEPELSKVVKTPAITPKRRRMASMTDAVMEMTKALTPTPVEKVVEAATARAEPKVGPSVPPEAEPTGTEERTEGPSDVGLVLKKKMCPKKLNLLPPKHPPKILTLLYDMLWVKGCLKKKLWKPNTTPGN
jgi:hypothetical protein